MRQGARDTQQRHSRPENVQRPKNWIHGDLPNETVVEAERCVLGCMMLHPHLGIGISGELKPEHFFRESHRHIFRALKAIIATGTAPDLLLVVQELRQRRQLKKAGGFDNLMKMAHDMPVAANSTAHVRTVRKAHRIRQGMEELNRAVKEARAGADIEEELTGAITRLSKLSDEEDYFDDYEDPGALFERYAEPDELQAGNIGTGLKSIDSATADWGPGSLIVIAGPPKWGKTAIGQQTVLHNASEGSQAAWFSAVEVPRDELYRRFLACASGVPHRRLTAYKEGKLDLNPEEHQRRLDAGSKLGMGLKVYWESSLSRIEGACQVLKQTRGLDLVVIDHIHNIQVDPRVARGYQVIPHRLLTLRDLAKRLQCVIIILAHLRGDWKRYLAKDGRPTKEAIRDGTYMSGTPTHIYLWHYPDYDAPEDEANRQKREFVVCEERGGEGIRKIVQVHFQGECYRIHDWNQR